MSKYLRIGNGDYNIVTKEGGEITLDTTDGLLNGSGKVIVTGDLEVKGDTQTINSTVVEIADNIIVLSKNNVAAGLPASLNYRSGIEVERGSEANAFMVYDEQLAWNLGGTSGTGTWTFEQGTQTVPIKATGMFSDANLYLNPGTGVISATNTTNYEQRVFQYGGGIVTGGPLDDDIIPNAKAVEDYVTYALASGAVPARLQEADTSIEAHDQSVTGTDSKLQFDIDNVHYSLNSIPFADHGALLDPPTADVSARCLSFLKQLNNPRDKICIERATNYLLSEQEKDGSWFGRWGTNYIY